MGKKYNPSSGRDLVQDVIARYPIEQAFRDITGTKLIGHGAGRMACCPFHEDKTPSLSVDVTKGVYKCHSAGCGAQGNVFSLIRSAYSMNFKEALAHAARACGIDLPEGSLPHGGSAPERRKFLRPPPDRIGDVPEGLRAPDLTPVPSSCRLPEAGDLVSVYDPRREPASRIRKFRPRMVHIYRNQAGDPVLLILRCKSGNGTGSDGGKKFFIPIRALDVPEASRSRIPGQSGTSLSWIMSSVSDTEYRPVYGRHLIGQSGEPCRVLLVEGEKTADATTRLIPTSTGTVAVSPLGGGASTLRIDWPEMMDAVRGGTMRELVIWPDADKLLIRPDGTKIDRQKKFALGVVKGFRKAMDDAGLAHDLVPIRIVTPPEGKESGWDLADAEAEGWTGKDVQDWIDGNSYTPGPSGSDENLRVKNSFDGDDGDTADVEPQDGADERDVEMSKILSEMDDVMLSLDAQNAEEASDNVLGLPSEIVESFSEPVSGPVAADDLDENDPLFDIDPDSSLFAVLDNPHFRPLGFSNGADHFLSLESGHIYALNAQMMRSSFLLKLARKDWWLRHFKKSSSKDDEKIVDWENAADALISASYHAGVWDPGRERGQGAALDGGRVVFNTGGTLFVEGSGQVPIRDFRGEKCYTVGISTSIPAFHNPFTAMDPKVLQLLDIIRQLRWKEESRELSVMGLFGWICVGPIAGIMPWRPHLWLSGPRSAGKSWILHNLIARALRDFAYYIKANSTEPGIRRNLHAKSLPLVFDEAEGETRNDRERIDAIIRMARHSASEDDSVVLQASSGPSDSARYRIRSSFLFSSITPQLDASADKTRFAHAVLNEGLGLEDFREHIELPARELLTPEFSQRFIARMIMRAPDMDATQQMMIHALSSCRLERRIVDVYSAFAAGAWLMLRDGVPENMMEAYGFIAQFFNIETQIKRFNQDVGEEKDHTRLFRFLQAYTLRIETSNLGQRNVSIGQLISIASGWAEDDTMISPSEAIAALKEIGIRPAIANLESRSETAFQCTSGEEQANAVIIHRNATPINNLLKETPYARSYSQVMLQASDVYVGKGVRFSGTLGLSRTLVVPLSVFSMGEGHEG